MKISINDGKAEWPVGPKGWGFLPKAENTASLAFYSSGKWQKASVGCGLV
jgi:hypothetical protein